MFDLPVITDKRGSLTFIESNNHIPFEIKRVFYIYDIEEGQSRGGHAHKTLHEFVVPVSGEFRLVLDNGKSKSKYHLNSPSQGVYIPPMVWCELSGFSKDAVCLALVSDHFDESDYFRSYDDFLKAING